VTGAVLIALIGIAGTVIGTLGSAYLTNRFAREREEQQWTRQVEEQRHQQRLNAYEEFAATALLVSLGEVGSNEPVAWALARLELRSSPKVSQAARELFIACEEAEKGLDKSEEEQKALRVEAGKKRDAFLQIVQQEQESRAY
jgi:hypothetical protein